MIGSAVGPAPYPLLVRDLQRVIGDEARAQMLEQAGRLPDRVVACVGGGSNAIGTFNAVPRTTRVELIGVEAGGEGLDSGRHGASLAAGSAGVLHGALSSVLQDADGQILEAHSVSAGLDYPGSGPSTLSCATAVACATSRSPTKRRSPPFASFRASRASSRRSSRPRDRLAFWRRAPGATARSRS